MDGENFMEHPYEQMDDLGVKTPYFWKHPNVFFLLGVLGGAGALPEINSEWKTPEHQWLVQMTCLRPWGVGWPIFHGRTVSFWECNFIVSYVLGSKLTLFSYGRDGHQPYSRGLYTHYKDSPIEGGMSLSPI